MREVGHICVQCVPEHVQACTPANTIAHLQDIRHLPGLKLQSEHQFLISPSSLSPSITMPLCLYTSDSLSTFYKQDHT